MNSYNIYNILLNVPIHTSLTVWPRYIRGKIFFFQMLWLDCLTPYRNHIAYSIVSLVIRLIAIVISQVLEGSSSSQEDAQHNKNSRLHRCPPYPRADLPGTGFSLLQIELNCCNGRNWTARGLERLRRRVEGEYWRNSSRNAFINCRLKYILHYMRNILYILLLYIYL